MTRSKAKSEPGLKPEYENRRIISHAAGAAVSHAEPKDTLANLDRARQATTEYQDVRLAREDGYTTLQARDG